MQKFIETTGDTRDAAIAAALKQLGMDRDDVSVEVLDNGKKGFLGIGATPARVRVTYEVPDEPVKKEEPVHKVVERRKSLQRQRRRKSPPRSRRSPRKSRRSSPSRMKTTPRAWSRLRRRTLSRKSLRSNARPAGSVRAASAGAAAAVRMRSAR